jgi:hypothetical protein
MLRVPSARKVINNSAVLIQEWKMLREIWRGAGTAKVLLHKVRLLNP